MEKKYETEEEIQSRRKTKKKYEFSLPFHFRESQLQQSELSGGEKIRKVATKGTACNGDKSRR